MSSGRGLLEGKKKRRLFQGFPNGLVEASSDGTSAPKDIKYVSSSLQEYFPQRFMSSKKWPDSPKQAHGICNINVNIPDPRFSLCTLSMGKSHAKGSLSLPFILHPRKFQGYAELVLNS
jgi:hypothetical protein